MIYQFNSLGVLVYGNYQLEKNNTFAEIALFCVLFQESLYIVFASVFVECNKGCTTQDCAEHL